ncbi:MAG TPA: ABC transporter substrate-binding protein [Fibrobacteraceae bacterium]|nr:ABC transporter substrate-binding protein [Fibrobacteraceae bacterium]
MVKNTLRTVGILSLCLAVLPGLAAQNTHKVTDPLGRTVEIPGTVSRYVCMGQGCLRTLCYLQAISGVVGVEQQEKKSGYASVRPYMERNASLKKLPSIGPGTRGDAELILSCAPQVIFWTNAAPEDLDRMQQKTGIPVLGMTAGNFADQKTEFLQTLHFLGKTLGKEARADSVEAFLNQQLADLSSLGKKIPATTKAYAGGLAFQGCHGLSATQPGFTPFKMLGISNVAASVHSPGGSPVQVDLEQVLLWNPDVLFIDQACQESVDADFNKSAMLLALKKKSVSIWPSNSYGDNWELTLANAFKIGYTLTRQGDAEQKKKAILDFLLGR